MRTLSYLAALIALFSLASVCMGQPNVSRAQAVPVPGVWGRVTDSASLPTSYARITLFRPDLSYFEETRTSAAGVYRLWGAPAGPYRLGVAARGRAYVEVAVEIEDSLIRRDFTTQPETEPGRWDIVGNTLPELFDATDIAVLLPDGRAFYCHDTVDPVAFNPVTGEKTFPAGSGQPQGCMNTTLLPDGRIVMVGGQEGDDPGNFRNAVRWVKAYSPLSNTWQGLPWLQHPTGRWYPGMARLADGSLLAMGGGTRPNAERTATCERLALSTLTWSYTGSMLNPSEFSPSALLYTGEVLATWSPPQLYNPTTGQWRATGNFVQSVRGWPDHSDHSVIVLADGRVAALGVRRPIGTTNSVMGEIYDPMAEAWSFTSNPALLRFQTEVVQLPNGEVLVAGGESTLGNPPVPEVLGIVKWCDLFDPDTNNWRRVADMNWFREYHAVTLLVPDGRVITTGGTRIKFQYGPTSADIEAFVPPYLLRGVRPEIRAISSTVLTRGSTVSLQIFPQTRLTSVVLIGTGAHTHWVDAGVQRRLVLPVAQSGSVARVTLSTDPNVLPLGHYMLFAMVDDIPSVALIVEVR